MAKSKDIRKEKVKVKATTTAVETPVLAEKKEKRNKHAEVRVMACSCKHPFQDRRYGIGLRVHNPRTPKGQLKGFRCTVCGTTKER